MIIAYTGNGKTENETQLKTHVSNLVKSENFGILLGAGASKAAGGMVMSEVWDEFTRKYENSYNLLFSENYLSKDDEGSNKNNLFGQAIDRLTEIMENPEKHNTLKIENARAVQRDLVRVLVDAATLNENLWGQPAEKIKSSQKMNHHIRVLKSISEIRSQGQADPWCFTLNYDLSLEWAARCLEIVVNNGFEGEFNKVFTPSAFEFKMDYSDMDSEGHVKSNRIYLVKMHGSLTWTIRGGRIEELQEIAAFQELKEFCEFEGHSNMPKLMILPGGSSYVRTKEYPHNELIRQFEKFLVKPDSALIIVGYGFQDAHINERIQSALFQNAGLKLVIYFPELSNLDDRSDLPDSLNRIIDMGSSNVTIIGGWENALFENLSEHLDQAEIQ